MIKFSDHSKHVYAYDATGKKLRAEYHTPIMVVAEPQVPDMGEEMPEQEEVLMEEQQEWNEEEWEEQEQEEEWTELEHEEEPLPHYLPPLIPQNGEDEPIAVVPNGNEPVIDEVPCEVTTVDYCGDFIYVNGKLKRMLFPGGYVTFRNDSIECPEYHFYITDHQGNVRIVANQNGEVEQVNHYYPYGGLMGESTNSDHQPYKYNGKELDRHHGLDWYDYGARWYNGYSWMNPDPLAEKYYDTSPYVYCHNNPMNKIDPTGMDDYLINKDGYIKNTTPLLERIKAAFGYGNEEDRVFMKGNDEPILIFPKGTIKEVQDGTKYSKMEIDNKAYAEKTFQTIISYSDVEWAHIRHGDGMSSSSLLINNHSDTDVSTSTDFARMYKNRGERISLFEHSHPLEKEYKKNGLPNLQPSYPPSPDDKKTAANYPNTIFKVYDIYNKKVYTYDKNGIKTIRKR